MSQWQIIYFYAFAAARVVRLPLSEDINYCARCKSKCELDLHADLFRRAR